MHAGTNWKLRKKWALDTSESQNNNAKHVTFEIKDAN